MGAYLQEQRLRVPSQGLLAGVCPHACPTPSMAPLPCRLGLNLLRWNMVPRAPGASRLSPVTFTPNTDTQYFFNGYLFFYISNAAHCRAAPLGVQAQDCPGWKSPDLQLPLLSLGGC